MLAPLLAFADAAQATAATTGAAESGGFFHFIFETYQGLGILIGVCLVLSLALAFLLERRTRKVYKDRGPAAPGSSFFDDEEDEESAS